MSSAKKVLVVERTSLTTKDFREKMSVKVRTLILHPMQNYSTDMRLMYSTCSCTCICTELSVMFKMDCTLELNRVKGFYHNSLFPSSKFSCQKFCR